ncbi:MAG TPA: PQQ-binding-like beta-propeller repeat protein [Vicinamibacterales bacterium]|nr:PQQ-binding-like beta-propeller repeat protein [Vicinamibacterales bacterium]
MKRALAMALLAIAAVVSLPLGAVQHDWPQFRGTRAGVAADDAALPESWSRTENVVWSTRIPGTGWSSPVVRGDHVFVTSVISAADLEAPKPGLYFGGERPAPTAEHRWMVYAIDFTSGRVRWEREVHRARPAMSRHLKNSYASETPVTDGTRVYAYFGNVGLFVFDMSGAPLWSKNFDKVSMRNGWGTAASPVLHRDRLYIVNDNDTRSFLAAFDASTGREIWRVARDERSNWATPFVWEHDGGAQIVTSGSDKVRAYDLEGRLKWELKGMSSIAIPTPFAAHDLLFISSGYVGDALRPMYAIRPGAAGDISLKAGESANAHIAWSHPQLGSYNTTALVYGDYLYTLLDRGFLLAHDARTGREIYGRQRLAPDTSGFTASPWAYNGKIFAASEDGDTFVIQAGADYKVLARNSLGEMIMASPAIARGSLVMRTASTLYRISKTASR